MKKCGVLLIVVGAVLSGVEGLRLKTTLKDPDERLFRTTPKQEPEELLDFDQPSSLDFYEDEDPQSEGAAAGAMAGHDCGWSRMAAITDAQWKAFNYDGAKTPSNYCHTKTNYGVGSKPKEWFCFPSGGDHGECVNTGDATKCAAKTTGMLAYPKTLEGWEWDTLPYDKNFKCTQRKNKKWDLHSYYAESCTGPHPSDSCNSNSAYCWEGKCIDVMEDPEVCDYAPHGTTKGKNTDDGWSWSDLNYDVRAGCFTDEIPPIVEAYTPDDIVDDWKGTNEPFRQLFMQRYLIWCEFAGWKNNKQREIANGKTYGRPTNLKCEMGRAKFDTPR